MGIPNVRDGAESYAVIVRTPYDDVLARVTRDYDEAKGLAFRAFHDQEATGRELIRSWENLNDIDVSGPITSVTILRLSDGLPVERIITLV